MQTFSSRKPESHLLNRLAVLSALILGGVVVFDLVAYKYYGGLGGLGVTDVQETAAE